MVWVGAAFLVIALLLMVSGSYFYIQYANSPQKAWRDSVLDLASRATMRSRMEREDLAQLRRDWESQEEELRKRALAAHLATIPVAELAEYPGIGPGTVSKLADAGYTNLAQLRGAYINLPGLGEKRLADIDAAVQRLVRQALTRFEKGACQESQDLAAQLKSLEAKYGAEQSRARARAAAADHLLAGLKDAITVARKITFFRHFWEESAALVPPEMFDLTLPDLNQALQAAEGRRDSKQAKMHSDGPPPVPKQHKPAQSGQPLHIHDGRAGTPAVDPVQPRPVRAEEPLPEVLPTAPPRRWLVAKPVPHQMEKHGHEDKHLVMMDLTIAFTLAAARAGGALFPDVRRSIESRIISRYKHDGALLNRARALCAHYESAAIDVDRCVAQIAQVFTPEHRVALVRTVATLLAESRGGIDTEASVFLQRAGRKLGITTTRHTLNQPRASREPPAPKARQPELASSPAQTGASGPEASASKLATTSHAASNARHVHSQKQPPPETQPASQKKERPAAENPRTSLEIDPGTALSGDLIRRQFRLLSERYAADRFGSMAPEFVAMAKERREAIHAAALALLQALGEPLESPTSDPTSQALRHNPDLDDVFGV
jgi:hypothetical protein